MVSYETFSRDIFSLNMAKLKNSNVTRVGNVLRKQVFSKIDQTRKQVLITLSVNVTLLGHLIKKISLVYGYTGKQMFRKEISPAVSNLVFELK